jgi:hypothetical protein
VVLDGTTTPSALSRTSHPLVSVRFRSGKASSQQPHSRSRVSPERAAWLSPMTTTLVFDREHEVVVSSGRASCLPPARRASTQGQLRAGGVIRAGA